MQPFTKTYKKGINLFHENDHSRELFVIQSGSVKVYRRINAKELELAVLTKGSVVGEMALIDGKPRSASAVAIEDSTVTIIDAETFLERVAEAPPWFISVIKTVSEKIRNANSRLEQAYQRNHYAAIALALHYMFIRSGKGCALDCTETITNLTRLLCISPQRCTEAMACFQKKGLLEIANNRLNLPNARRFHDYCFYLRILDRGVFDSLKPLSDRTRTALRPLRDSVELGSIYLEKTVNLSATDIDAVVSGCSEAGGKQAIIAELRDVSIIAAVKGQTPATEETGTFAGITYCIDRLTFEKYYLHNLFSSTMESSCARGI